MQFFKDEDSERVLICQMILDNKIIPELNTFIRTESFTNLDYAKCYERIINMFVTGTDVNQTLFMSDFKDLSMQKKLEIMDATFTSSNWKFYAGKVRDCYIAREMQKTLLGRAQELTPESAVSKVTQVLSDLNAILSNTSQSGICKYADMIPDWITEIDNRIRSKDAVVGTPTGIENLDDLLGGGLPNEIIYLGARPSIGKTALALQVANSVSKKMKTLFFEFEMQKTNVTTRAVVNESKLDIKKVNSGFLTLAQQQTLQAACERLYQNENMMFAFPRERDIGSIVATIRAQALSKGVRAVFIDHIGLIKPEGHYHSTWEGIKEISNTFQMLQRELGIMIFILIQLNKEAERKDADLANVSGSDTIVQDADIIMTLERERQKSATEFSIPAKLKIQKNRNGACGECPLIFMSRNVMFVVDNNPPDETKKKTA